MYFYEIHLHTAETSRCGRCPAAEMVRDYKERGFSGVVITDHFVNGNSYAARWCSPELSWKERMDVFVKGYNEAAKAGKEYGIDVWFGWEYTYLGTGEDYLILSTKPEQLYTDFVDCDKLDIESFCAKVHAAGGFIVRAHPYREAEYMKVMCIERPGLDIDAVEGYNAGNEKELYNERAVAFAKRENKPITAGSDTHNTSTNAQYYIGFEKKAADIRELCDMIRQGKAFIYHGGECIVQGK